MTQNKNQNIICLDSNDYMVMQYLVFFLVRGFKWINPKDFDQNKNTSNSPNRCALAIDLRIM